MNDACGEFTYKLAGPWFWTNPSQGAVDLVLTDVLMPGQTGPEMIAAMEDRLEGVAVLFVTGFTGEADADLLRGRTVLRKPFTMAALGRAIDEAVDQEARRTRAAAE